MHAFDLVKSGHVMNMMDAATDRFFRAYKKHCIAPDEDTLFNLLNALHSFHDKFREVTKSDLFALPNFLALKALRNLFHHEDELLQKIRVVSATGLPITTDLAFVCLIERTLVERAAEQERKYRDKILSAVLSAFKWYGSIVNIQPCVFNCAVDVFEAIQRFAINPSSAAYSDFEASYRFEEENDHSHRVTGDILCHASNVNEVLRQVFGLTRS